MEHDTQLQKITSEATRFENGLLGYLLSGNVRFEEAVEVVERLAVDEFYSDKNRLVYAAIKMAVGDGVDPNVTGIMFYLKQFDANGVIKASDVTNYVVETDMFSIGLAMKSLEIIKAHALQRRLIQFHEQQLLDAKRYIPDLKEFIAQSEYKLLQLEEGFSETRKSSAKDIGKKAFETAQKNFDDKVIGLKTGFSIDGQLGGFFPGHMWILGAYTGTGKTFLSLQMALSVLKQQRSVGFFSLEMSAEEIFYRLAGNISGKGAKQLETGKYQQDLNKALEQVNGYGDRLHIYDDVFTFESLRLKCKKQKLKYGLDVFFIDFIQNMRGDGSIYERMSTIIVQIQQLAKELQATAVILSQISNENAAVKSEVLTYKGAGEIAQVADVGLWLEKVKDREGEPIEGLLKLIVRKSRHSASNLMCNLEINFKEGGKIHERPA